MTERVLTARELNLRRAWQEWSPKQHKDKVTDREMRDADACARRLADGPRSVRERGNLAKSFVRHVGLWVDLVRAPPSGT